MSVLSVLQESRWMKGLRPSKKAVWQLLTALPALAEKTTPAQSFPRKEQVCLFPTQPVLYLGYDEKSLKVALRDLQTLLCDRGYLPQVSGKFDAATETAVKQFQSDHNLYPDGIVGPFTWAALFYPQLAYSEAVIPDLQEKVEELQNLLCEEGFAVNVNGHFDRKTEQALKRFQKIYGLVPDGICDAMTWAVLLGQRQKPEQKFLAGFYLRLQREGFLFEQVLMLSSVYLGICLSPTEPPAAIHEVVGMAYILAYLVPPLLSRLELTQSLEQKFRLLRFAPYVLTGYFWKPIFSVLEALMVNLK